MARTNRNLDVDMDYSKIEYEKMDDKKRVDAVDLDAAADSKNTMVVIADSASEKRLSQAASKKSRRRSTKEKAGVSKIRKQSFLGAAIVCSLLAVLLVVMVQGKIEMNETAKDIATLKKELSQLEAERKSLNSELDSEIDMLEVEQYALANGMVSQGEVNRVYVGSQSTGEDDVQVYEPTDELFDGFFGSILSAISESFMKTWNTISRNE